MAFLTAVGSSSVVKVENGTGYAVTWTAAGGLHEGDILVLCIGSDQDTGHVVTMAPPYDGFGFPQTFNVGFIFTSATQWYAGSGFMQVGPEWEGLTSISGTASSGTARDFFSVPMPILRGLRRHDPSVEISLNHGMFGAGTVDTNGVVAASPSTVTIDAHSTGAGEPYSIAYVSTLGQTDAPSALASLTFASLSVYASDTFDINAGVTPNLMKTAYAEVAGGPASQSSTLSYTGVFGSASLELQRFNIYFKDSDLVAGSGWGVIIS